MPGAAALVFATGSVIQLCVAAYCFSLFVTYSYGDRVSSGLTVVDIVLVCYTTALAFFFTNRRPFLLVALVAAIVYNISACILVLYGNDPAVTVFWHALSLPSAAAFLVLTLMPAAA